MKTNIFELSFETTKIMVKKPLNFLLALLITIIGVNVLPLTIMVNSYQSDFNPIEKGIMGIIIILILTFVSFIIEIIMILHQTSTDGKLINNIIFALKRSFKVLGLIFALLLLAIAFDILIALPLFSFFGTQLSVIIQMIFPFIFNMTVILFATFSAIALFFPIFIFTPFSIRFLALRDSDIWDSIFSGMTIFSKGIWLTILCVIISLFLDIIFWFIGFKMNSRDLNLLGITNVIWIFGGVNISNGILMIIIGTIFTNFKISLWTILFNKLLFRAKDELEMEPSVRIKTHYVRNGLLFVVLQFKKAFFLIVKSPKLMLLSALIAFIGMPGFSSLLTLYNLFPNPSVQMNQYILNSSPDSISGKKIVFTLLGLCLSFLLSATLIISTYQKIKNKPIKIFKSILESIKKLHGVFFAELLWFVTIGMIGGIIIVIVLFSLSFIVQYFTGLDKLVDSFNLIIIVTGAIIATSLYSIIARTVLIDDLKGTSALSKGINKGLGNYIAVLMIFFIGFSLELIRGPLASYFGMITSGWADLLGIIYGKSMNPPLNNSLILKSIILYLVATFLIGFTSVLWTQVYSEIPSERETKTNLLKIFKLKGSK